VGYPGVWPDRMLSILKSKYWLLINDNWDYNLLRNNNKFEKEQNVSIVW
jgi:hypothetical protein